MRQSKEDFSGLTNRIIKGTKIKGEITSSSDFRLDGELEGDIKVQGKLVVGKDGIINGKVVCSNADIGGLIKGSLMIDGILTLKSTAIIEGDVSTNKLIIEQGAIFHANCNMKEKENQKKMDSPPQKS